MRHVSVAEAGPAVADVMLRAPRRLGPGATVADARGAFANPREHLLLVCDGARFLGAVTRADVADRPATDLLGPIARPIPTLRADDPITAALAVIESERMSRVPVVGPGEALEGLVCWNATHGCFCTAP